MWKLKLDYQFKFFVKRNSSFYKANSLNKNSKTELTVFDVGCFQGNFSRSLQKEIKNPVGFSVVNGQSIYLPDKDLKSQIAVYSLWVLQQCEYPIEEIEWLVDLILKENPNSKIELLDVLKVHKNEL